MALNIPSNDGAEPQPMMEINTTPLIDVLLVLLVMLIITIPVQLQAVNIEMPGLNTPPPPVEPEIVRIDVLPGGRYVWSGEPLEGRSELDARLLTAARGARQPEIHVRPHRAARYDSVAAVLSSAQRLGLVKIGLVGSEQFASSAVMGAGPATPGTRARPEPR